MRLLFIGDIVGQPGLDFVRTGLPALIAAERIDLVVANAENVANGSGLTPRGYRQLRAAGVDLVTMGDHIYKKIDLLSVLNSEDRICKPANFPPEAPGRDWVLATARDGTPVAALGVLGRTFMRPVDCPFHAADRVLAGIGDRAKCILVDVHAEATADEQIFAGHTAFVSDVGMTGPYDGILGRRVDRVLHTAVTFVPTAFDVADGDVRLGGALVDIESATGRATSIRRVMLNEAMMGELRERFAQVRV